MSAEYLKEELYAKVRQDSELFEFLQAGSLDGIWYWDITRPENEWMSPEFKRIFGYEDHEVPNTSAWWQEHIDQSQLPDVMKRFQAHLEDPANPYDQIVCYKHKDGSDVWVRCRGLAIRDEDGTPIRMLGCHTDVTRLKKTEAALREHLKELALANTELERFTSVLSHDLQEPLRQIQIFSEAMQESLEEEDFEGARALARRVQATTSRMSTLVTAMSEYAQLGHNSRRVEIASLDNIIASVREDLGARIDEKQARLDVRSPLPSIPMVTPHMYQLFLNLLNNALKFQPADQVPEIKIWSEDGEDMLDIYVQDNGIGFNAEAHGDLIFEPFKRLHSRSRYEGTGIGLSVCEKIVLLHGGELSVESAPGEGSTFKISLPLVEQTR